MKGIIYTVVLLIGVVLIGAGAYYFWQNDVQGLENETTLNLETAPEPRPLPERCGQPEGAECLEYVSTAYNFSLFHSSKQIITEYDEGSGAATIVFENAPDVRGFQIFIVPYSEPQVTEERFNKDVRTGVRQNVTNLNVDGATAAAFDSESIVLGETYEVWFVKDGFLYEVTVPRILRPMIEETIATWKFI